MTQNSTSIVSWNVNGIRAVSAKPEWSWFTGSTADIIGLQETKAEKTQLTEDLANPTNWHANWLSSKARKGYSGVATFARKAPLAVTEELPVAELALEGRCLQLEFEHFYFFNIYFPNGGSNTKKETAVIEHSGATKEAFGMFNPDRLQYKMNFFDAFLTHAEKLRKNKPIVVCGDFNIAHKPIDLARPKENTENTGFLPIEREWLDTLESKGYIDTFRHVNGNMPHNYSWWSYKTRARERNVGWRIDYIFVSDELKDAIQDAWIEAHVFGSDHCPVGVSLNVPL